ncbi:GerAB/ArcD/ProY family transporter [Cohnella herbarum]|uniref:Endospore germination permease n=1 Tax=Cohnella herbarum TaxID=2728023 RepID=A0A7Z2VMI8_9BACL|nr:endospore germination permease [Cohnella herbarum]QJD85575.1 endospore germination permease [Cohnella herbarum]
MKKDAKSGITFMQFIFIIHGSQLGTGIFSLPKDLAEHAGTDGWISLILGWSLSVIASIVIVLIFRKFPNDTLPELMIRLFGKIIGKVLIVPVIFYFAFFVWTILTSAMMFIKQWFLPMTPDFVVMLLLIAPGFLVARKSLRILGRYCELVFYIMMVMFFLFLFPIGDSHWIHLLPILKEGWFPVFQGVSSSVYSFLGFEIVFFIYPYLQKKQMAIRGVVIANTITLLYYLEVTLICFAFFSPDGITEYNQPVFNLLKIIDFDFLERIDMLFLAIYLFEVSTTWLPFTFGTLLSLGLLFGTKNTAPSASVLFLLIVVLVFFIHPSWNQNAEWMLFIGTAGIGFAYVFPVFLYLYVLVFNRLRRSESL